MNGRLVTVFGGSGFIGRHIVQKLASEGCRVRVAVRDVEGAKFLLPRGDVGQVSIHHADLTDAASIAKACDGADAVVNAAGVQSPSGKATYQAVNAEAVGLIAKHAKAAGAAAMVHISGLGADSASPIGLASWKGRGEEYARQAWPAVTILRPSIVFGPEDHYFNRLAGMLRISPVLPVIGGNFPHIDFNKAKCGLVLAEGGPLMQPVYVGDVVEAVWKALTDPTLAGQTFELGGPDVIDGTQAARMVLDVTRRGNVAVSLPWWKAKLLGHILGLLPNAPFTADHVELMKRPNVVGKGAHGFADLGITPKALGAILPTYLAAYRPASKRGRQN
jgi:uncharacterized protein YbjT (DUF2867 family)